jgi:hypothetical protein
LELIAQYPITESAISPHCGRPVAALLANGEFVCGILERVHEGNIILRPPDDLPEATLSQIKKSVEAKAKKMNFPKKPSSTRDLSKPRTSAFGFGGYGGWGWGGGSWILPLLFLTALFAFPFFWI